MLESLTLISLEQGLPLRKLKSQEEIETKEGRDDDEGDKPSKRKSGPKKSGIRGKVASMFSASSSSRGLAFGKKKKKK